MDYLAFGLLAGSLIVIASFVVRDALPHLSAIGGDSRLSRLSRAESPSAWGRWCADAGLVLAAAGTLVLLITVAALLADLGDDAGNIVVGLSVAVAVVASVLGCARLGQRLRWDTERELGGAPWTVASTPARATEMSVPSSKPAAAVQKLDQPAPRVVKVTSAEPGDVWDDDLPMWSPSTAEHRPTMGARVAEVAPERDELVATVEESGAWGWSAPSAEDAPPRSHVASGGLFSSPLLADIGLPAVEEQVEDGFRSPLLSDLHDGPVDDGDGDDIDLNAGSDLLLDEAPAPVGSSGRQRDEIDDR